MGLRRYQKEIDALKKQYLADKPEEETAREDRNSQLKATDYIVSLPDYPPNQEWLDYRQELRDWPATDEFPDNFPSRPKQETPTGY